MSKTMGNLPEGDQAAGCDREMDINGKLVVNLRELSHIMRALYEGKASQKRILIIIKEVESITQRDLTMRLGIQPGSVSEILSKLENAGLIQRTMSETDRRTANISLTDQGKQMACEAAEQRSRRHGEMFSCLTEHEKEELLTLLEKVNTDWKQRYKASEERRDGRHPKHECGHGHKGGHGHDHGHGHEKHRLETEELTHVEVH